jgi:hypothetical protein
MDARVAWILGLTAAGVAVAAGVAAAASQPTATPPATPPPPGGNTPAQCPAPSPGTVTGRAPVSYAVGYPQTNTTLTMDVGDTVTVALLRVGTTPWVISEDDQTVVLATRNTTQPDPNSGGTDDVSVFTAQGPGTTTIRGSGSGTFTLNVKVQCP